MKFKYENKLIPKPEIKFETDIESLINDNLYSINMFEASSDIKYNLFDSTFSIFGTEADENKSDPNDPWYKKVWKFIKDLFLKIIGYIKAGFKWIKNKLIRTNENKTKNIEEIKEVAEVVRKLIATNDELKGKMEVNTNQYIQELYDICYEEVKKNKKISEGKTDRELRKMSQDITKVVIDGKFKVIAVDTWIFNEEISERVSKNMRSPSFVRRIGDAMDIVDGIGVRMFVVNDIIDMTSIIKGCIYLMFDEDRYIEDYYDTNIKEIKRDKDAEGTGEKLLKYTEMISLKVSEIMKYNDGDDKLLVKYTASVPIDNKDGALDKLDKTITPTVVIMDAILTFISNQERNLKALEQSVNDENKWGAPDSTKTDEESLKNFKENTENFKKCLSNLTTASNNLIKFLGKTFVSRGLESSAALSMRWHFVSFDDVNDSNIS